MAYNKLGNGSYTIGQYAPGKDPRQVKAPTLKTSGALNVPRLSEINKLDVDSRTSTYDAFGNQTVNFTKPKVTIKPKIVLPTLDDTYDFNQVKQIIVPPVGTPDALRVGESLTKDYSAGQVIYSSASFNNLKTAIEQGKVTDPGVLDFYYQVVLEPTGIDRSDFYTQYFPEETRTALRNSKANKADLADPTNRYLKLQYFSDDELVDLISAGDKVSNPHDDLNFRENFWDANTRLTKVEDYKTALLDAGLASTILKQRNSKDTLDITYFGKDRDGTTGLYSLIAPKYAARLSVMQDNYADKWNEANAKFSQYLENAEPELFTSIMEYMIANPDADINALMQTSTLPTFQKYREIRNDWRSANFENTGFLMPLTEDEANAAIQKLIEQSSVPEEMEAEYAELEAKYKARAASDSADPFDKNPYLTMLQEFTAAESDRLISNGQTDQVGNLIDLFNNMVARNSAFLPDEYHTTGTVVDTLMAYYARNIDEAKIFGELGNGFDPTSAFKGRKNPTLAEITLRQYYADTAPNGMIVLTPLNDANAWDKINEIFGTDRINSLEDLPEDKLKQFLQAAWGDTRGLSLDTVEEMLAASKGNPNYVIEEGWNDLRSYWIDKYVDTKEELGGTYVFMNALQFFTQTMNWESYVIKPIFAAIDADMFFNKGEGGYTQNDVTQTMVAPTFADARTNDNKVAEFNTGWLTVGTPWGAELSLADLGLEIMSDFTFVLDLGTNLFKNTVGKSLTDDIVTTLVAPTAKTVSSTADSTITSFTRSTTKSALDGVDNTLLRKLRSNIGKQVSSGKLNTLDDVAHAIGTAVARTNQSKEALKLGAQINPKVAQDILLAFTKLDKASHKLKMINFASEAESISRGIQSTLVGASFLSTPFGLPAYLGTRFGVPPLQALFRNVSYQVARPYMKEDHVALDSFLDVEKELSLESWAHARAYTQIVSTTSPALVDKTLRLAKDLELSNMFAHTFATTNNVLTSLLTEYPDNHAVVLQEFESYLRTQFQVPDVDDAVGYFIDYWSDPKVLEILQGSSRGVELSAAIDYFKEIIPTLRANGDQQIKLMRLIENAQDELDFVESLQPNRFSLTKAKTIPELTALLRATYSQALVSTMYPNSTDTVTRSGRIFDLQEERTKATLSELTDNLTAFYYTEVLEALYTDRYIRAFSSKFNIDMPKIPEGGLEQLRTGMDKEIYAIIVDEFTNAGVAMEEAIGNIFRRITEDVIKVRTGPIGLFYKRVQKAINNEITLSKARIENLRMVVSPYTDLDNKILSGVETGKSVTDVINEENSVLLQQSKTYQLARDEIELNNNVVVQVTTGLDMLNNPEFLKQLEDLRDNPQFFSVRVLPDKLFEFYDSWTRLLREIDKPDSSFAEDTVKLVATYHEIMDLLEGADVAFRSKEQVEQGFPVAIDERTLITVNPTISTLRTVFASMEMQDLIVSFKKQTQELDFNQMYYYLKVENSAAYSQLLHSTGWLNFVLDVTNRAEITRVNSVFRGIIEQLQSLKVLGTITDKQEEILNRFNTIQARATLTQLTTDFRVGIQEFAKKLVGTPVFSRTDITAKEFNNYLFNSIAQHEQLNPTEIYADLDAYVNGRIESMELTINEANRNLDLSLSLDHLRPQYALRPDVQTFLDSPLGMSFSEDARLSFTNAHDAEPDTAFETVLWHTEGLASMAGSNVEFKRKIVYDIETTSLNSKHGAIVEISWRDLDHPDQKKTYRLKSSPFVPEQNLINKAYEGKMENFNKLLDPENGFDMDTEMVQQMLTDIRAYIGDEEVLLVGYNSDDFDRKWLSSRVNDPLFADGAGLDMYPMMQQKRGYFKFTEGQRGMLRDTFDRYMTNLLRVLDGSEIKPKLLYGADGSLADILDETGSNLMQYLQTGSTQEYEDAIRLSSQFKEIATGIYSVLQDIKATNKGLFSTLISKEIIEGNNNTVMQALLQGRESTVLAVGAYYRPKLVINYFDLSKLRMDAVMARRAHQVAFFSTKMHDRIPSTDFLEMLNLPELVTYLKGLNINSRYSFLLQGVIDPTIDPKRTFVALYQLAKRDAAILAALPDEFKLLVDNPDLIYSSGLRDTAFGYVEEGFENNFGINSAEIEASLIRLNRSADYLDTLSRELTTGALANSAKARMHLNAINNVRKFLRVTEKYSKIRGFGKFQNTLNDYEAEGNLENILKIGLDDAGKLIDPDEIISHFIYRVGFPMYTFDLSSPKIKVATQNLLSQKKLLNEHGIDVVQLQNQVYVVLTDSPSIHTNKDALQFYFNGKIIEPPKKSLAQINLKAVALEQKEYDGFIGSLMKAYEDINNTTNEFKMVPDKLRADVWHSYSSSLGSLKDVITTDEFDGMYKAIPDEVKKVMTRSYAAWLNDAIQYNTKFNFINVGTLVNRRILQPRYTGQFAKRMSITAQFTAYQAGSKLTATQAFFNEETSLHIGSDTFKKMCDIPVMKREMYAREYKQMLQFAKDHPDYKIAALKLDKNRDYKLIQIKPILWQDMREAERLGAVFLDFSMFDMLYNKINYDGMGNTASRAMSGILRLYKWGQLTNIGTVARNAIDNNPIKFMASTGASFADNMRYHTEAMRLRATHNSITNTILKMVRNAPDVDAAWNKQCDLFWENTPSNKMTRSTFDKFHKEFQNGIYSGLSKPWENEYLRRNENMSGAARFFSKIASVTFSPLNATEEISRLAHYLYTIDHGGTVPEAIREIDRTYFNPAQSGNALIDFVFPYYNFVTKNLGFWFNLAFTKPKFFRLFANITQFIYGNDPYTTQELADDPLHASQLANLSIPLYLIPGLPENLRGAYMKLNFSVLDLFRLFVTPGEFVQSNLFSPIQLGLQKLGIDSIGATLPTVFAGEYTVPDVGQYDAMTVESLLYNIAQFAPIISNVMQRTEAAKKIVDRTGTFLFPTLFTVPYNADIVDDFRTDYEPVRTVSHKDAYGNVIHVQEIPLGAKEDTEANPKRDPFLAVVKSDYVDRKGEGILYELIDLRTGKTRWKGIYPQFNVVGSNSDDTLVQDNPFTFDKFGNVDGRFRTYYNDDGTYTWVLYNLDGTVRHSGTRTSNKVFESDTFSVYLKQDEDGTLVESKIYYRQGLQSNHYRDSEGNFVTEGVTADGEVMYTTTRARNPIGVTYTTRDMNGNITKVKTVLDQELRWERATNGDKNLVYGYDSEGNLVKFQSYTELQRKVQDGTWLTSRTYSAPNPANSSNTWKSESYYNPDTKTKVTYNFNATGEFLGKTTETYKEETKEITKKIYTSEGLLFEESLKDADFNYLEYYSQPRTKKSWRTYARKPYTNMSVSASDWGTKKGYDQFGSGWHETQGKFTLYRMTGGFPSYSLYDSVGDAIRKTLDSTKIGASYINNIRNPFNIARPQSFENYSFRTPKFYNTLYTLGNKPRLVFNKDRITKHLLLKDNFRYFRGQT